MPLQPLKVSVRISASPRTEDAPLKPSAIAGGFALGHAASMAVS